MLDGGQRGHRKAKGHMMGGRQRETETQTQGEAGAVDNVPRPAASFLASLSPPRRLPVLPTLICSVASDGWPPNPSESGVEGEQMLPGQDPRGPGATSCLLPASRSSGVSPSVSTCYV